MRELEKRQRMKRGLYSVPALFVVLLVAIVLAKGAYTMVDKAVLSNKEVLFLAQKIEALELRETKLEVEAEKLQTMTGIEEEIKTKFNVARVGEDVALIVESEDDVATTTPAKESWWKRLWGGIIREPKLE